MIEIDAKTLIAQMVNFGILLYLLKRFLFKPVGNMLDKRSQTIKGSLEEIEKDREEIAKLRDEYQERMTQLDKDNYRRMQEAIQKGQEAAAEKIALAEKKAGQIVKEAKVNIEREREEALKEVRNVVGDLAIEIASKVMGESYDTKAQTKLITRADCRMAEKSLSRR